MMSKEDVKAQAYMAGVRDPVKLDAFMRVVDHYAFALARRLVVVPESQLDPFAHLMPGESDLKKRVTRCKECSEVLQWDCFTQDRESPTRHRNICRRCSVPTRRRRREFYLCRVCGESKPIIEFPVAKQEKSSLNMGCNACGGKDQRKYKCVNCHQMRFLSEFPEWKSDNPGSPAMCLPCTPGYARMMNGGAHDAG
jgi:hypothetical protein